MCSRRAASGPDHRRGVPLAAGAVGIVGGKLESLSRAIEEVRGKMNSVSIDRQITRIAETIGREYEPQRIILFGSYARGKPTKDSDIDLFIIKDTNANRIDRFVQVKRIIYDPQLRIPVSPLVYTPREVEERLNMGDDFVKEIVLEGKVLYEEKS
jgi:predicted nucleotidyltransferase